MAAMRRPQPIPPGTRLRVRLPGQKKWFFATVNRCSAKMKSCYVENEDGSEIHVDLTSADYEVTSPEDSSGDSDSFPSHPLLASLMETIDSTPPDELLQPSGERSQAVKQTLKEVVDSVNDSSEALHVDGFDAEQIWVQLESLSKTAMRHVNRVLQRSADLDSVIPVDIEEALDELLVVGEGRDGSSDLNGSDDDDDADLDDDWDTINEEDGVGNDRGKDKHEKNIDDSRQRPSWEDDYLNLDEMEAFLQEAEEEYARDHDNTEGPEGDPDDEALDNVLDEMMNQTGRSKQRAEQDDVDLGSDPLANAKYDDFFAPVSGQIHERRGTVGGDKGKDRRKKRVHFIDADDTDGESEEDDARVDHAGNLDEFPDEHFEGDRGSDSEDDDLQGMNDAYIDAEEGGDEDDNVEPASRHQLRLDRMSNRIQRLEEEALGEREWYMRGEISGSHRPMNSALEVDLDFETTMKPPPQPTEETTQSLEDLIKHRIAEHQFDDVIPILPAKEEKKKTTVELDDVKSTQGLGQIYEDEYMAARTQGASEDKEQPIRDLAKKQFIDLCAKLDQLSHGQFRPLPAIEEVTFKVDVPAIMMEEATPAFVNDASMRRPEEVFRPGQSLHKSIVEVDEEGEEKIVTKREGMMQADGIAKSEAELTREDRKRRRAAKKRANKKRRTNADAERIERSMAAGREVLSGRKSEEAAQMLRKLASTAQTSSIKSFKSREVFSRMNDARDGKHAEARTDPVHLKL